MKSVKVILSPKAKEVYIYLNEEATHSKTEKSILNSINQKIEFIKINPHYGNPISKDKIPNEYKLKYENINLFRVELSNFWRMLYTLTEGETKIEVIAFVLDIIDHKIYNKKFGYNKG